MPAAPESYGWLSAGVLGVAGCVTVVSDADVRKVEEAFGCDPAAGEPRAYQGGEGDRDPRFGGLEAWVGDTGGACLVIEENGFQGSRSEVLRPASKASALGLAASVYWNVDGLVMVSAARKGKVVFAAELVECDPTEFPRALRRLAAQTADESADLIAVGAAMVETFTGVSFDRDALDRAGHRSLTPVPDAFMTWGLEQTPLRYVAPDLVDAIAASPVDVWRPLALWVAAAAVAEAGIADEPAVRASLDETMAAGTVIVSPALGARVARWERELAQWRNEHDGYAAGPSSGALEEEYLMGRFLAGQTLLLASHPDPLEAALQSTDRARVAYSCSRLERGTTFVDDDTGRWSRGRTDGGTSERIRAFTDLLLEALGEADPDWAGLTARLPPPLTSEDRQALVESDQRLQDQGAFDTWQYDRRR